MILQFPALTGTERKQLADWFEGAATAFQALYTYVGTLEERIKVLEKDV